MFWGPSPDGNFRTNWNGNTALSFSAVAAYYIDIDKVQSAGHITATVYYITIIFIELPQSIREHRDKEAASDLFPEAR